MKSVKKLLAVLLALMMTFALAVPAFADDPAPKHDLIIEDGSDTTLPDEITQGENYTLPTTASPNNQPQNSILYGWSVKIGSTGEYVDYNLAATTSLDGTKLTDDVYIKPIWGYKVTYTLKGGTGTAPTSVIVPANKEISFTFANIPTDLDPPTGKTFAYWELDNAKYAANATKKLKFTNNATIEAIYETSITVDFQKGDTAATGDEITGVKVAKNYFLPTLAEANAKRATGKTAITAPTDKVFAGWKVGDDTTIYQPGDLVALTKPASGNVKIVAQWKKATNSITINGANKNHSFDAYQIFTGDVIGSKLTNIQWGNGIDTTKLEGLSKDLKELVKKTDWYDGLDDSTTPKVSDVDAILSALTKDSTAAAFAEVLNMLKENGTPKELEELANILAKYKSSTIYKSSTETASPYTIKNLPDGYYFVVDNFSTGHTDDDDFISDYILKVVSDVTVNVKGSVPTVDKKVSEDEANYYEDAPADDAMGVKVGDTLNYKIEGTLPTNYADYKEYGIVFTDTMDEGLTLVHSDSSTSIALTIGSETVDPDDYTVTVTSVTGGTELVVKIADLKAKPASSSTATDTYDSVYYITASSKITLTYDCVVNEKAVLDSDGVKNEVKMNFTNDPNQKSSGTPPTTGGETPPDETVVEVTNFKFVKTDGSSNALLIGAEFKLYDAVTGGNEIKFVACYTDSGDEKVVDPAKSDEVAKIAYYRVATADEISADTKITDIIVHTKAQVIVDGLDADKLYYLEETVAPKGYNKLSARIEIQPNEATDKANASSNIADGKYTTTENIYNVQNNSGTELPATGGEGTVLFITVGAVLFMAAGIVLTAKKRLYNEG